MAATSRRERIKQALQSPYMRAVLDMLAEAEGGDYNVSFGGSTFSDFSTHPNRKAEYVNKKGQTRTADDAGRYQFSYDTFRDLSKRYGFTDFTPETQDEMAVALMMDVGAVDDILKGDFETALNKLGRRWYSLPTSEVGREFVGTRSLDSVYKSYNTALEKYSSGQATPALPPKTSQGTATFQQSTALPVLPNPVNFTPPANFPSTRELLNRRYGARRLVTMPGPLTNETAQAMANTLYSPTPETSPYPILNEGQPTLLQAPGALPATVPGDLPLTVVSEQSTPMVPISPDQHSRIGSFDTSVMSLMTDPVSIPAVYEEAKQSPIGYLESALQNMRTPMDDFMQVAAWNTPYSEELLSLIANTPVTLD